MRCDKNGSIVLNKKEVASLKYAIDTLKHEHEINLTFYPSNKKLINDSKNSLSIVMHIAVLLGAIE